MEKTVITFSVENMITVVVMAVLGFAALGLIFNLVNSQVSKRNEAN